MRYRPIVSALLLAAYLPACAGYQQTTQPLAELTAPPKPVRQVRVTLANGSRVQVTSPHVEGDTLRGTAGLYRESGAPVAIPLASITGVEIVPRSTMSTGTSAAVMVAAVGALVLGVYLLSEWGSGLDELSAWGE